MQKRPLGVLILSILFIISGLGILIMQILLSSNIGQLISRFSSSENIFLISMIFFMLLTYILSGIGMFLGKKWGWWLGAFCFMYAVIRNINSLIVIFRTVEIFANSTQGLKYYLIKHIGRIATNGLAFSYFFKDNVTEYFKIMRFSKLKTILILIGSCIGVSAIFSGIYLLLT